MKINGSSSSELLTGTAENDQIFGQGGDDTIQGGIGNDSVEGSNGDDSLNGEDGNDTLEGGPGDNTIDGGEGDDSIKGGETRDSTDLLRGGAGNDRLFSDSEDTCTLEGGEGDDYLSAKGAALILAGSGNDGVHLDSYYRSGTPFGTVDGGDGFDTLELYVGGYDPVATLTQSSGFERLVIQRLSGSAATLPDSFFVKDSAASIDASTCGELFRFDASAETDALLTVKGADSASNFIVGGALNDSIGGGTKNDTLQGFKGNDTLDGGKGADVAVFAGNFSEYTITTATTGLVVSHLNGAGTDGIDLVQSMTVLRFADQDYAVVEPGLYKEGTDANDSLIGSDLNDTLLGLGGKDIVRGAFGDDFLDGGEGDDNIEGGVGNDTMLGGNGNDEIKGSTGNDSLEGGSGNDTLYAAGPDTCLGGDGDDVIIVDGIYKLSQLDGGAGYDSLIFDHPVRELAEEGVFKGFEEFYLGAISGTIPDSFLDGLGIVKIVPGSRLDMSQETDTQMNIVANSNVEPRDQTSRSILAGALDDTLIGAAGADTLKGGGGNDFIDGGARRDTAIYLGNAAEYAIVPIPGGVQITDSAAGRDGNDVLLNVNRLQFADQTLDLDFKPLPIYGTNQADYLYGDIGDDEIHGLGGGNHIYGGDGDDAYYLPGPELDYLEEEKGEGVDTVYSDIIYTLGKNFENLTLTGDAIQGTGNSLSNLITGNSLGNKLYGDTENDTLSGSDGNDTLIPGTGSDVANGDAGDDYFVASEIGGNDTFDGGIGQDTASFQECLQPVIASLFSQEASGSEIGQDVLLGIENLLGGNANDQLTGDSLANLLDGKNGADSLVGGSGNDTYAVNSSDDVIVESGADPADTVQSKLSFTLVSNLENLELIGSGDLNGIGNAGNNLLIGNDSSNTLDGRGGNDTMSGGRGRDLYLVDSISDLVVENAASTSEIDAVESSVSFSLGLNIENLILMGNAANGTGNERKNSITGNAASNILNGKEGADKLTGKAGNDIYFADSSSDAVVETGGSSDFDIVKSTVTRGMESGIEKLVLMGSAVINGTGNSLGNQIVGNRVSNRIDGKTGADTMKGEGGGDTYVVDDVQDVIVEAGSNSKGGADSMESSVSRKLEANIENLLLIGAKSIDGTGNRRPNFITGNSGANRIDGGEGADTLSGGAGNDTYICDSGNDILIEGAEQSGIDLVVSSVSYSLAKNFENLTLGGTNSTAGTGNDSGNRIIGNLSANTIDGGGGFDTLQGGDGDDRYVIDNLDDQIAELAGEKSGVDMVLAKVSWTLGSNLENLELLGKYSLKGTGNSLSNLMQGNEGGNALVGGAGRDTLMGGSGNDTLTGVNLGTAGAREKDELTGGAQSDWFVLGDTKSAFYDDGLRSYPGRADYAYITDFEPGRDQLQVHGKITDYTLGASGVSGMTGVGLYLENGNQDELIAVIQGKSTNPLNLDELLGNAAFV